jgi:hypothetical protein
MKLRILGDTVRLRLSRSEVERMLEDGRVEQAVHFGVEAGQTLRYALVADAEVEAMCATFSDATITVYVPTSDVRRWATTDQVGMRMRQVMDDARVLDVLVEKDFQCLEPRPGEEAYDGFPNPKGTC